MIPLTEAAKQAHVSRQYLHAEIKRNKVPGARMQWGRWLIPLTWVRARQRRWQANMDALERMR